MNVRKLAARQTEICIVINDKLQKRKHSQAFKL